MIVGIVGAEDERAVGGEDRIGIRTTWSGRELIGCDDRREGLMGEEGIDCDADEGEGIKDVFAALGDFEASGCRAVGEDVVDGLVLGVVLPRIRRATALQLSQVVAAQIFFTSQVRYMWMTR